MNIYASVKRRASLGIVVIMLIAISGCSNPLSGETEATPDTVAGAEVTPTPAAPIPIVTPTPVDPTAVAVATKAAPAEERPSTYVVAENDTLYGIAARFDVEISVLVEVNGLSDPNDIQVGQELTIPPLE